MVNIPGVPGNATPDIFTRVSTLSSGASVPGNTRITCIIGLGTRQEVIVASATGGGKDGLNSSYTSISGSDGRHFTLKLAPVVSNRTTLFKNGVPLKGLEAIIDSSTFNNAYDYRIDIDTAHIELQRSHLVDQGGSFYKVGSTNIGLGTVQNLTLQDVNAPTETWTIKCVSVQRNNLNQPIASTARFVAFGSISGNLLDANGNPVVWVANNTVVTNTVLQFSILEGVTVLREGDFFTIKVKGGVLNKNDTLTATYIATTDINDPVFFNNVNDIATKHGQVTLDNTLSLGAFLFFAQSPPGLMALQAAPSLPRRTSYDLTDSFAATSTTCDDFILPLPLGVSPDPDSNIHFFITNPATGVETQVLPNKFPFFTLDTLGNPATCTFVQDDTNPPGGNSFSYSVNQSDATINFGTDGYLNRNLLTQINATFGSASITFDSSYIGKTLKIFDAVNSADNGSFDITTVSNGLLGIVASDSPPFDDFVNESSVSFRLIDSVTGDVIASSSGTDGALIAIGSSATATLTSAAINFGTFDPFVNGYDLEITASTNGNVGLYDITAYNSGTDTLTIAKCFVSEHDLKFEVIDTAQTSDYVVVNHNVVPNGYSLRVTLVDVKDSAFFDAGWVNALATLEAFELDILVPLPKQTISVIFENALTHCHTMSNTLNKKERVLFIGAINGLIPDNITGAKAAAVEDIGVLEGIQGDNVAEILSGNTEDLTNYSVPDTFGNTFRCVYFYPDQIVVQVGGDNQFVDGFYMAAAGAGFCSANANVAIPLTRKILSGFTILRNRQFTPFVTRSLAGAGVCLLQPVAGGGRVVWGITTTQSGFPEEQEISIVFIRDRIAKSFRSGLQGFIGQVQDNDTIATVFARAQSILKGFISQKLITDFKDLTVTQDAVDPRQINVGCRVQPSYPIDFIFVDISVGLL